MKKKDELEEQFRAMPAVLEGLRSLRRKIQRYHCYEWEAGTTKEDLQREYDLLIEQARSLSPCDLYISYYAHRIRSTRSSALLQALRRLYLAEWELKALTGEVDKGEYFDLFGNGGICGLKNKKISREFPKNT